MKWRLLAVACVLLALGLLLYPLMGELVSEKYHSDVEAVYTAAIADTDNVELAEQRRAAEMYNALLRGEAAVSTGGASAPPVDYAEQLTVGEAMCTIDIPKIGVYLPVRHGTGAETLERAVGHVVGTSLPVGGVGTHAVLSAHSGMASAKLFSDISFPFPFLLASGMPAPDSRQAPHRRSLPAFFLQPAGKTPSDKARLLPAVRHPDKSHRCYCLSEKAYFPDRKHFSAVLFSSEAGSPAPFSGFPPDYRPFPVLRRQQDS